MTAPSDHLDLAAEFPPATRDQWRELVAGVLRKSGALAPDADAAEGEKALSYRSYDGIEIAPLYTADDLPAGYVPPGYVSAVPAASGPGDPAGVSDPAGTGAENAGSWDVRQRFAESNPARANAAILTDLENGVTSLWLQIGDTAIAVDDLAAALQGVYLDLAAVVLDAGAHADTAARTFLSLIEQAQISSDAVSGSLGGDPIAVAARSGEPLDLEQAARLVRLAAPFPALHAITVDGTVYHDAGASDAQELAIATSAALAYLRVLTSTGEVTLEQALASIEFRFAVTDDQFNSIAKLRAARRIWARVAQLCGAPETARGQRQHAVTSTAMLTQRDAYVNMLRVTVACFAGAVGGAQAITVAPFDAAIGQPDDLARRIARNTQSVLHDESSLGRVIDPAGGSWYVESLTDALAEAAWAVFTALEAHGGAANLAEVAALIAPVREKRQENIAHRRDPITGVSEFPLLDEALPQRASHPVAVSGGLPKLRYAEPFERLRDRSDEVLAQTGSRPTVFLAAVGPVTAHSGRLGFATNLFAAGGIEGVVGTGEDAEIIAAFTASKATVACLCSSDKVYAERAASLAAGLVFAGARLVWLAGQPGERADSDKAAGIGGYLFVGCDALDVLNRTVQA